MTDIIEIANKSGFMNHTALIYKRQILKLEQLLREEFIKEQSKEVAEQSLSKTPAQSLQEHDDEVIERCAKVCDDASQPHQDEIHTDAQWAAKVMAANIRALKGK